MIQKRRKLDQATRCFLVLLLGTVVFVCSLPNSASYLADGLGCIGIYLAFVSLWVGYVLTQVLRNTTSVIPARDMRAVVADLDEKRESKDEAAKAMEQLENKTGI